MENKVEGWRRRYICTPYSMERGCECCNGKEPIMYLNDDNFAIIDIAGEMVVVASGNATRFKIKCCPNCGRRF